MPTGPLPSLGDGPDSLYAQLMAAEGDTLVLQGAKSDAALWSPERHLSAEVFDLLVQQIRLWLGTRMIRHHDRTGKGAQNVTVELTVRTAGPLEVGGEPRARVTLDVIDGRVRVRALEAG